MEERGSLNEARDQDPRGGCLLKRGAKFYWATTLETFETTRRGQQLKKTGLSRRGGTGPRRFRTRKKELTVYQKITKEGWG